MKKIIVFVILIFLIFNKVVLSAPSSEEYLNCLSERLYNDCKLGAYICENDKNGDISCSIELQPFTQQSIFNHLKNYENQFVRSNIWLNYQRILACKIENDIEVLDRYDADYYTLDDIPVKCPSIIYEEHTFIKFQPSISFFSFSPFSINLFPITITLIGSILFFIIKEYNFLNWFKIYKK